MPNPETVDYVYLERVCRRELRLFNFLPRELCVLSLIIDHSFAIGRAEAFFQTQDQISALTQISKGNVSGILSKMEKSGVMLISRGIGRYAMNSDASAWRITPMFSDSERRGVDRLETMLIELNTSPAEQLHLLPPLPDLDVLIYEEARHTVSSTPNPGVPRVASHGVSSLSRDVDSSDISDGAPASGRRGDQGAAPAAPPSGDHLQDPERLSRLIAASLNLEVIDDGSHFGNSVPNSGTPHISAFKCDTNVSHINESYMPPVPISGTDRPRRKSTPMENELLESLLGVTSKEEMKKHGGWWREQIRVHASLVREAIGDLKLRRIDRQQKPVTSPGGWLRKRYQSLVRHMHQNS